MNNNTYHVFFRNLSNNLRINIIAELKKGDLSVTELVEKLKVEQSKISHALSLLKRCNIVKSKIEGKKRIYSLNKRTILPILKLIDKHEQTFCGGNCKFCKK